MKDFESLAHVRWECRYHVIFIPKYRQKVIYVKLRGSVGGILWDLRKQKGIGLLEGHAMSDHLHLCLSIPPKYSVAYTVGFLKGKSAVRIHRELLRGTFPQMTQRPQRGLPLRYPLRFAGQAKPTPSRRGRLDAATPYPRHRRLASAFYGGDFLKLAMTPGWEDVDLSVRSAGLYSRRRAVDKYSHKNSSHFLHARRRGVSVLDRATCRVPYASAERRMAEQTNPATGSIRLAGNPNVEFKSSGGTRPLVEHGLDHSRPGALVARAVLRRGSWASIPAVI
jgi:REP element-mobilizing transposase RayT